MTIKATNLILETLPRGVRANINSMGNLVDLEVDGLLYDQGVEIRCVYFPYTGFVSRVATVDGHPPMEMAIVGNEGMLGASLVTGIPTAPLRAVVRGAGAALQVAVDAFQLELQKSPALRLAVGRYLYVLITEIASTAVCSNFHAVGPRLARWLLETHDRTDADHFDLTHQSLADMLGVQRSAVSIAANLLQQQSSIQYSRGRITVIDRAALEAASCECYAVADLARLHPPLRAG